MTTARSNQTNFQRVLLDFSAELVNLLDEEEICQQVARILHDTFDYEFVGLFLLDEETGECNLAVTAGWENEPGSSRLPLGTGMIDGLVPNGKIHYSPEAVNISNYVSTSEVKGSELDVPIWIGDKVLGVLVAAASGRDRFNQDDIGLLTVVAQQVGISIQNSRLRKSLKKAQDTAEILRTAHVTLAQSLDMNVLCETLLDSFFKLIPYDSATICLLEDETKLRARAVRGYEHWGSDSEQASNVVFEFEPGTAPYIIINTRKGTIIPDVRKFPKWITVPSSKHVLSMLGVPMLAGGKVIGVCFLDSAKTNSFTDEHIQLAEALATQAAFAIQNANLFDELYKAKEAAESQRSS